MPQLTLAPSFLEGQLHALHILSSHTVQSGVYTNNKFIEDFIRELIDFTEHHTKLNTISDGGIVDKYMTTLDSIVKSFNNSTPEFDERVTAVIAWTIMSQLIYTNEFMLEEYSEMLRDILGKLI